MPQFNHSRPKRSRPVIDLFPHYLGKLTKFSPLGDRRIMVLLGISNTKLQAFPDG
jgi:hypothetical protein